MRERYLPAIIMLMAGAVTCIIDIYRKAELLSSLKRLLLVLIIFYIIGLIAKAIIMKVITPKPNIPNEENLYEETDVDGDITDNISDDEADKELEAKVKEKKA